MTAPNEDRRICDDAIDEVYRSCFAPNAVSVIEDADRLSVTDISTAAVALEGGFYLARQDGSPLADEVGFVLADNDVCQVSCLVQCDLATQSLCITSPVPEGAGEPFGCHFCGEFTQDECQAFIAACES